MGIIDLFLLTYPRLFAGLGMTLKITLISLVFASIIGILSCMLSISQFKPLRSVSGFYIDIMRGLPVLVLAFFIYFGIPQAIGVRLDATVSGIITLSLNAGAYLSEIFRGGIQAVSGGQMEAARSLGMPRGRAMRKVVLPQAIKIVIPSMVNQFIITLKDTSILSVIGMTELTQTGKLIIANNMESFKMWALVALFYLIPITILSKISKRIEANLAYGKGQR